MGTRIVLYTNSEEFGSATKDDLVPNSPASFHPIKDKSEVGFAHSRGTVMEMAATRVELDYPSRETTQGGFEALGSRISSWQNGRLIFWRKIEKTKP